MDVDDVPEQEAPEMEVDELSEAARLQAMEVADPQAAMAAYAASIASPTAPEADKVAAFQRVAPLYAKHGKVAELKALVTQVQPFLEVVSKAKGGKLFRIVIDAFLALDGHTAEKVAVCEECIAWANAQKRRFLRQTLEIRLCVLFLEQREYQKVLSSVQPLIKELKKMDDKNQLVDVQLMESKAFFALSNYPRSRGALVAARTTATSIYCPPKMQAALDLQSGILHAQEKDFKTAYSYFYESFEGYDSVECPDLAIFGLKYMLLSKIMLNEPGDVPTIMGGKLAIKYAGKAFEAMNAVATASKRRSLADFEQALLTFKAELSDDLIVQSHVADLYDKLLQQNLAKLVEPYSRVEIARVAKLIQLDTHLVETKLSQMILDKHLNGILDQGAGCLELFEDTVADKTYAASLETIGNVATVVEALSKKAQKLI